MNVRGWLGPAGFLPAPWPAAEPPVPTGSGALRWCRDQTAQAPKGNRGRILLFRLGELRIVVSAGLPHILLLGFPSSQLTAGVSQQRLRYAELDSELTAVQGRIERLLDALADGSILRDEIAVRLNAEKTRKDALASERDRLPGTLKLGDFDADKIKADLQDKVRDVKGVLERQDPTSPTDAEEAPR
jgi:hypothetical protein